MFSKIINYDFYHRGHKEHKVLNSLCPLCSLWLFKYLSFIALPGKHVE